jgi:hypothetical protein
MKENDIVRVNLPVTGFGNMTWEDEIKRINTNNNNSENSMVFLKNSCIEIPIKFLSLSHIKIAEGARVEMWNGGDDTSGAFMGWYVEYNKVTGKHLVSSVKNKLEGRKWWDHARAIDEEVANEILEGE